MKRGRYYTYCIHFDASLEIGPFSIIFTRTCTCTCTRDVQVFRNALFKGKQCQGRDRPNWNHLPNTSSLLFIIWYISYLKIWLRNLLRKKISQIIFLDKKKRFYGYQYIGMCIGLANTINCLTHVHWTLTSLFFLRAWSNSFTVHVCIV